MTKMPPVEKIHEALSAIADKRVRLGENEATVESSGSAKQYTVRWEGDVYSSTDSATYWQAYPGYPVIATLLLQGRLPLRRDLAGCFAGVNWTELNRKHKRNYSKSVAEVMQRLREEGCDLPAVEEYIATVYAALIQLDITIRRGGLRPPQASSNRS